MNESAASSRRFVLGTLVAAYVLGTALIFFPSIALGLAYCVVVGIILLVGRPPITTLVILGLTLGSVTQAAGAVPIDLRILAVPLLIVLWVQTRLGRRFAPAQRARGSLHLAIGVYVVVVFAGGITVGDPGDTILAVLGLVYAIAVGKVSARGLSVYALIKTVASLNLIVAMLSTGWLLASSAALSGGRVVGIFGNANALALFCALTCPAVVAVYGWRSPVPYMSIGLVLASGSRAGLIALIIGLSIPVLRRRSLSRAASTSVALLLILLAGASFVETSPSLGSGKSADPGLVRRDNSRGVLWSAARSEVAERPFFGVGLGSLSIDTANSLLRILAETGIVGLMAASPFIVQSFRRATPDRGALGGVVAGGLANAIFESWFLVGGSPFFVLFLIACAADIPTGTLEPRSRRLIVQRPLA